MNRCEHLNLMAAYNQWMNTSLYEAAGSLPANLLAQDRGAFFKSIVGTLNHLVLGDTIWLQRFASHPAGFISLEPVKLLARPTRLDEVVYSDFAELSDHRELIDQTIVDWAASIVEGDLDHILQYRNTAGSLHSREFYPLLIHFFNHQTHHRGQATTLLTQAGVEVGTTDLLALIAQSNGSPA